MSNSSGRSAKDPADDLQFLLAVKALPDGLTPKGCLRTTEPWSAVESFDWAGTEASNLTLFEGRSPFPAPNKG
jgi:hypothetical protein